MNPTDVFIEKLLEKYIIEGPVFGVVAGLVPPAVAQEPTFNRDRKGFIFEDWSKEELDDGRPDCLNYIRDMFAFYETTILSDGREWVLGGKKPSLADIEGECLSILSPKGEYSVSIPHFQTRCPLVRCKCQ